MDGILLVNNILYVCDSLVTRMGENTLTHIHKLTLRYMLQIHKLKVIYRIDLIQ